MFIGIFKNIFHLAELSFFYSKSKGRILDELRVSLEIYLKLTDPKAAPKIFRKKPLHCPCFINIYMHLEFFLHANF